MTDSLPTSGAQFLSPDILFHTELITNTAKEGLPFEIVELVRKNQPLVRLIEDAEDPPPKKPVRLLNGEHTVLSDDRKTLLAAVDGYPFLSRQKSADHETVSVSMVPLLSITEDEMEAAVTLYPPVKGCEELSGEQLFTLLTDNGIRFGLDLQQLHELLRRCRQEQIILSAEPVARGFLPMHGRDSFLRFEIEVGPLPGKILGNGKIDFRERKMFVGVKKGEAIATRIPATSGTPGINVLGKEIPQQEGKDIPVTVSDDAEYDEASGVIRALHSGILSLVNDTSIKVCAKQIISSDIDFSTGNIESNDAVEITGSIHPGFKVNTKGDLLIGGSVRSAFIHCRGNLVIQAGIIGNQGKIRVEGDTDLQFIEQGQIKSSGRVIIRKQAYYSTIMAKGDIHCEESSQIISGMLLSGGSISLGSVGSANAPPTLLAAGVDPEHYLQFLELRSRLEEREDELHLWLQRHGQQTKDAQRKSLEEAIHALEQELHIINLIPGSSPDTSAKDIAYLRGVTIIVHGTIFSGTKLQIGNATTILDRDLETVRFFLNSDGCTITETHL